MHFNVFDAAPENERDGPNQHQASQGNGANNVWVLPFLLLIEILPHGTLSFPSISYKVARVNGHRLVGSVRDHSGDLKSQSNPR